MWPFKSQMKSLRFALCPSIRHKDIKLLCYECFYWFNQINRSSLTVGGQMSSRGIDPECFWQAVGASDRNLQMKLLWRRWSSWFPLPSGNLRPGSAGSLSPSFLLPRQCSFWKVFERIFYFAPTWAYAGSFSSRVFPPEFSLVHPAFPAFPSASNYFIWTSGCLKYRLLVAWFVGGALKQSKRAFSATHAKTEARIFPSAGMPQIAVLWAEL